MMKRLLIFAATVAAVVLPGASTANAAGGQQLCLGAPGHAVTTPDRDGDCRRGTAVTVLTAQDLSALEARVSALESDNTTLRSKVAALEADNTALQSSVGELEDKLSAVHYDETGLNGRPTLKIAGANLQLVNGGGTTDTVNGLGNLFVGYDEFGGTQTGSHNVILGTRQTFTSYGGIMGGGSNTLSGPGAVVFGGGNTASGSRSAVTGGSSNVASGAISWIGGAQNSDATAQNATVSGGANNTASGVFASISGGSNNVASGASASISGGGLNEASGNNSSILGGRDITVSTQYGTAP